MMPMQQNEAYDIEIFMTAARAFKRAGNRRRYYSEMLAQAQQALIDAVSSGSTFRIKCAIRAFNYFGGKELEARRAAA